LWTLYGLLNSMTCAASISFGMLDDMVVDNLRLDSDAGNGHWDMIAKSCS
jgi:hypothetical protein